MQTSTNTGTTGPVGRADPSLPQVFGRYLLVQRLSRGGMGEIFLAKHGLAGFEKLAVIKKVLPNLAADTQFISRFVDEAQVAIKLQHVNVAQVFEVGRVGDEYFLALEYVEGRDLRRILAMLVQKRQRLPVDMALFIARELANGLAYAHRRTSSDGASLNLVHCDISPPNVLVSFEGETKVIDFGIAKSALRGTATDPKMGFGKFGYMAPEQLIRGGIVDHRTDIYAAGVVLFELLTGQRLYEAGPDPDYRALAKKVAKGEHKLPSDVDKALAPYDDLVATALRPKAEDRYQTAAEFRDAIQQALVAVNPTISTDQLGAYMRELFAPEMTAQRELHERVAKTRVEDFQEELTKETGTTISFALANLPLKPPEVTSPTPRPRTPTSTRSGSAPTVGGRARTPTRQTDILEQPAASEPSTATSAIPTTQLALADGTGAVEPSSLDASAAVETRRGNRLPIALVSLAIAGVVGVIAYLVLRGDEAPAPAQVVSNDRPQPQIRVESIPPDEQRAAAPADAPAAPPVIDMDEPDEATSEVKPETRPEAKTERKRPRLTGTGSSADAAKKEPTTAKSELTRDAVIAKFRAAKQAYEAYKAKNGGRYDAEWNDLMTFQQYKGNDLEEFARRIEAFRAKLRD